MEIEGRVFDICRRPAVVVDHSDTPGALQNIGRFHHIGAVCIHHHHQCAGAHLQQCICGIGQERILILRRFQQTGDHRLRRAVFNVHDDTGFLAFLAGNAANAHRSAQGVHIGKPVTHDIHLSGVAHQLAQRRGHHAGFDLGAFLRLFGTAAEKFEIHIGAHHRLVAAAGQSHVDGKRSVVEQLLQRSVPAAHTDAQRGRHALGADHLVHGIEQGKLFCRQLFIVLFFKHKQIAVALVFAQQAVA